MVLGLSSSPIAFKGQKYARLKSQLLKHGELFCDPEFPPDDKALFSSGKKLSDIEWKRPRDICAIPKLFVDGADSSDINQGELANCWFVAACSCLATDPLMLQKAIPNHKEQEWDHEHPEKYAGIFHFRFWIYGEWVDVVVDDFLPTRWGRLVYVHSTDRDEFWSALLEKAFVKLRGCYEDLDMGELSEALEAFTGGIAEPVNLVAGGYAGDQSKRNELYKIIKKAANDKALLTAAINVTAQDEMETTTPFGLVRGHAYGITAVRNITIGATELFSIYNKEELPMIRLRNPWGDFQWLGAFSDLSSEWCLVDGETKEKIGLNFEQDGEFWMLFDDFCEHFTSMAICRKVNTSRFSLRNSWHECVIHGEWKAPHFAGGCPDNRDSFLNNPQAVFDITKDEDDVLVSLTQKSSCRGGNKGKIPIGFAVMRVELNRTCRLNRIQEVVKMSTFKNSRTVFMRYTLPRGRYVLVSCTYEKGVEELNMLRIYTKSANHGRELVYNTPRPGFLTSYFSRPRPSTTVTRIRVIRAVGLKHQGRRAGGVNSYVIFKCEGRNVTGHTIKNSANPAWNVSAVFYRCQPLKKVITVEVWSKSTVSDSFLGQHKFKATREEADQTYEVDLFCRKRDKFKRKMYVQISSSRNITFL